jgi:hypothetical protein
MATSIESALVEFVSPDAISGLRMHPSIQLRIQHYLEKRAEPYIG